LCRATARSSWATRTPASAGYGELEAFGLPLGDGEGVAVADGDGQGVALALAIAVADGLADPEGEGLGVGDGVGLGVAVAEPEGVGGGTQILDAGGGENRTRFAGELALPLPSRNNAAGTTSRPRMTVITKASAPHSWSQKAGDELRIRALRPSPVAVCCGY
jgi:hypothetical protein